MIIAFTGAGISKASGIPTFEDMGDLRTKLSRSYSISHKKEYQNIINFMSKTCEESNPNDAHFALAEYDIPVITMNIDRLHQRAGSKHVLAIHGNIPNIVLYEDPAPNYQYAMDWVFQLDANDIFLIVGTSFYTNISEQLRVCAIAQGARVVILNKDAETNVRAFIENNKDKIGSFEEFMLREPSF